jgi:tRNA 2-selenouridine synthase
VVFLFPELYRMPVEQIETEEFLRLAGNAPILDVRSPDEYKHAHIPNAFSFPLFTDEQRKIIGITYKQEGRQEAVGVGLNYFSGKMHSMLSEAKDLLNRWYVERGKISPKITSVPILIHCWRGGMRSNAIAWLLSLYGFKIYTLKGGYKAFRNWVLAQFEKPYNLKIVGGYTGSGKTDLLEKLNQSGNCIVNLEKLANHKGSAFGWLGEGPQPEQEMFENLVANELSKVSKKVMVDENANGLGKSFDFPEIWLEDESQHIGSVGIPRKLWEQMRKSPLYFLDIPFKNRLQNIITKYGKFSKEDLTTSILKIQKRLGGLETKNAINYLSEENFEEAFSILLRYYDKLYLKSLTLRENLASKVNKIPCETVDSWNVIETLINKGSIAS